MSVEIKGVVKEIVFKNEENGYVVADVDTDDGEITVVGYIPIINVGETMSFTGNFTIHPIYGKQLQVVSSKQIMPSTLEGIISYLSSGLIKGIGPKMAERIVKKFGKDSLDVIQYRPHLLTQVNGIGEKKAKIIAQSFEEQREIKEVMLFLQQYGISVAYAMKIYKKYRDNTIEYIRENPYRLADDITGIGFKMADSIAKKMGVDPESPYRIMCGIKFVLNQYSLEGHTFAKKNELIERASNILSVDKELVEGGINTLTINGEIHQEDIDGEIAVFSMAFYYAETGVCKKIIELANTKFDDIDIDLDEEISRIEKESNIALAEKQKLAIKESVKNGVTVITGGPGTGKTTTVNSIIKIFEKMNLDIALAAPTGRAAKRLTETTGREAKTIHRLLEYSFSEDGIGMRFIKDGDEPLTADVIIVDEVSMIDILLMYHLLKAVMPGTRLILVGDVDQLPSVGPGNVLHDIIGSEIVKVVKLTEIFRQAEESMIVVNAHKINKGLKPILNAKGKDFYFISKRNQDDILNTIKELCLKRLPNFSNCDPIKDIQVLTPMKNSKIGTINLNCELQDILNPKAVHKKEKKIGERLFRVGDKVMQVKNNYNIKWKSKDNLREGEGIFNGDIGYVCDIDEELKILTVLYDDEKYVEYDFAGLDEIELAYSITIHKSQGSEFPIVVMPVSWAPPMLLNRNLLYTAVTRAKELVVLVGAEKYLYMMIKNKRDMNRNSGLKYRFKRIVEVYNQAF
ncbi:ATP-dependent DNA helicase, RecD/TraA family [Caminicella sporogenes DSM 14501]|uniref:ATP-dependent RecD2 DNA helicase n=1 Tax=Caminicella sporogenes DSM 14501 TaxID=1121266 RepID=A0A1M6Q0X5_9FIRM|nr:ATP-dependent RecD-like DNA helicase [Caminicella sporogenes]RKD23536.1 AAA family ATPase [Caminicella sporogenes]SHK13879.1 ATP-dependent DNA helicase, RecD/TraA family [Caminicella sporogenes DSM 14501]